MIEVRNARVAPKNGRHRGVKGFSAEALNFCLEFNCWAVGEYPPDCHESGALSWDTWARYGHVVMGAAVHCHSWLNFFVEGFL